MNALQLNEAEMQFEAVLHSSNQSFAADFRDVSSLKGERGYSAYEVALAEGFDGTEEEWLASLKGEQGDQGQKGDAFTYDDFTPEQLESLQGEPGVSGVYIGSDTPPETANVWIDPSGQPSNTEEWKFELEDGSTVTKTVVIIG